MAFSKIQGAGVATDTLKAEDIAADAIGTAELANDVSISTSGNIATTGSGTLAVAGTSTHTGAVTNSSTSQLTGQVTIGTGSGSTGSWTLPTTRGDKDQYVLSIDSSTGASAWVETQIAPTLTSFTGKLNAYEAPYSTTGNTQDGGNIRKISNITTIDIGGVSDANIVVGQYISGTGIPANTTITAIDTAGTANGNDGTITISADATSVATGTTFSIQKTPDEKSGGALVLTGTDFGETVSEISVNFFSAETGGVGIPATYISNLSGTTNVTAEWTGNEANYNGFTGNYWVEISKGGLKGSRISSGADMSGDPTISNFTVANSTSSVTLTG